MTPDDPDGNAVELQAAVDNETSVELAPGVWPCAPIHLPADHAVRLSGYGATIRATGITGLEAWMFGEGSVRHVIEGVSVEAKGEQGVGFRPGSQWTLRDVALSGLRAGVNIVDDKCLFENFTVNKSTAGFLVGPTDKHAGGQSLHKGGAESCAYGFEVSQGARMEAWEVAAWHLGNVGTAFGRPTSGPGDPPLLIDCVFTRLGAERLGARYHDPGPGGVVGGNVWVGGNCSLSGPDVGDVSGWRGDNLFLGTEAGQWDRGMG